LSNLADKTEKRVLNNCARAIKILNRSSYLDMTKEDDWDYTEAVNNLHGIIQTNGYEIDYSTYKIKKSKKY